MFVHKGTKQTFVLIEVLNMVMIGVESCLFLLDFHHARNEHNGILIFFIFVRNPQNSCSNVGCRCQVHCLWNALKRRWY